MFSVKPFICDSFAESCKALVEDKDRIFGIFFLIENSSDINENLKNAVSFIKICATTDSKQIQKRLFEELFVSLTKAESSYSGVAVDMSTAIQLMQKTQKERQSIEEQQSTVSACWEFFTGQNKAKRESDFQLKNSEKVFEDSFSVALMLSYIRILLGICYKFMGDENLMLGKLDQSLSFYVDFLEALRLSPSGNLQYASLIVASASAVCEFFSKIEDSSVVESLKNYNHLISLVPLKKILDIRTYWSRF